MKMKRYLKIWVACVVLLTAACTTADSLDEDYVPEEGTELIGTFFVENRQMTLRLIDITSQYDMVGYQGKAVPVQHTSFDNLPEGLKETVKNWALSAQTQVYRMKWKGEEIYHLLCLFMDENTGVYRKSGERVAFASMTEYMQFLQEASDICCILLIDVEVVRSADGAPNLLVGTWQTDWRHLHHDVGVTGTGIDDQVPLYADLPFSITEICQFEKDGTGYLRSIKTYRDGTQEMALDPFTYKMTDYLKQESEGSTYQGYYYKCFFAAGDTIEYTARTRDGFNRVFDRYFAYVTYPWYRLVSDPYDGKTGSPKYGRPQKSKQTPIVGRWSGNCDGAAMVFGKHTYHWVFRADGTGYQLQDQSFMQSFAYTVDSVQGENLELTIYKYDTGFTIDDGFWTSGDFRYHFVSKPVPQGKGMKAKLYGGGDKLEIEGWTVRAADYSVLPIVFRRIEK